MSEPGFSQSSADEQLRLPERPAARPLWPWLLLLLGLGAIVALRATLMPSGGSGRDGQGAGIGTKLAKLSLEPLTGDPRPVSLADLEGKVTLINFWGPWCGPCAIEFPHLLEIEQHFRGNRDFQFLSVSSSYDPSDDRGLAESTEQFLRQQQADIATYRDPQAHTIRSLVETAGLEGFGFPTTLTLDRAGIIRGIWTGYRPGDERGMLAAVEGLLRSEPVAASSEPARQIAPE